MLPSTHHNRKTIVLPMLMPIEVLPMVVHSMEITTVRSNESANYDSFVKDYCYLCDSALPSVCCKLSLFAGGLSPSVFYLLISFRQFDVLVSELHHPILHPRSRSLKRENTSQVLLPCLCLVQVELMTSKLVSS